MLDLHCSSLPPRHVLLANGRWGGEEVPLNTRLHRAYLSFKTWCSTNRIGCSQPAFRQKMVAWLYLNPFWLRHHLLNSLICVHLKSVNLKCIFSSNCFWVPVSNHYVEPSCTKRTGTCSWSAKPTTDVWSHIGLLKQSLMRNKMDLEVMIGLLSLLCVCSFS